MTEYVDYLQQKPNLKLAKLLVRVAIVLTVVVLGLVGLMRQVKIELPDGISLSFLPPVHAVLNSCVAVFLVVALIAIKRRNIGLHKKAIAGAMICSISFLLCYVAYHFTTPETKFGGEGVQVS